MTSSSPEDFRAKTGLEQLRELFPSDAPPSCPWMGNTLNFDYVEIAEGRVVFGATPDERFYNRMGTVHGGYTASLLDTAAGCAVHSKLRAAQGYTTLELKVAYHRAISSSTGPLRAEGRAIQVGARVAFGEASLRDLHGTLYASASTTCLVFPR